MNFNLDVNLKLQQKLALTPELIQTIKILQLNAVDLKSYVEEELLSNPLLEINEEIEKERVYDALSHRFANQHYVDDGDEYDYEDFVKAQWSLSDFLHMQLAMVPGLEKKTRDIAEYIIDTLDDNGYRTERATEIAAKLGFTHDEVMNAIKVIQGLEPAGVSAKSLEECLRLQLDRLGEHNEIFECIISKHLEDLAANRISLIAKDCEIEIDECQEYCDIVRSLDPKPGKRYGKGDENRYITPDCYLDNVEGEFYVSVNEGDIPRLQMSNYYTRMKQEALGDEATMSYLKEKVDSAMWLMKGIDQRRQTIQNVAEAIVDFQREFFEKGKSYLRPMTLADIASRVDVHESTVSRTVNGKYIQTPRGLFELKYFFGGGTVTLAGEEMSSSLVKDKIEEIVKSEDPKHPYSDEKIKALLEEKYKVSIARRTVAKYREQLGILGTSKRKRY